MLYRFGDCSLDTARLELRREGQLVEMQPQVFAVLICLVEQRDRVVSRAELQRTVWGRRVVTDSALSVRVRTARLAVGDDGRTQSVIKTLQGTGYRFVADVDVSASPVVSQRPDPTPSTADDDAVAFDLPAQPSVVVLPLRAFGDAEDARLFAEGLTSDITTRIGRSRTLFVIARGSASAFAAGTHDVRAVGTKLGVRYVVQGSVQLAGRRLRITASLADTVTRQEIWSEHYDRALDDWMLVQHELADLVVSSLHSEVERAEERRSLAIPTANLDAWSAYHRGRSFMFRFTPENCARAEYFFRRSIDLEPGAARAYAGLSFVHYQRAFLSMSRDLTGEAERARDFALRSLAADPSDPMGHWALSRANQLRGELQSAKREVEIAVAANPSYAVAQYSLGWVAMHLGERQLCADRIDYARRLSPYDPLTFAMLLIGALNQALGGDTAGAGRLAASAILQPNVHYHGLAVAAVCHALDGQVERARSLYSRVRALAPLYDLRAFLAAFPFRIQPDLSQVRRAFSIIRSRPVSA